MEFSHYEEAPAQVREKIIAEAEAAQGRRVLAERARRAADADLRRTLGEGTGRVPDQTKSETIRLTLSAQAQRYAQRDAPRDARLMAARGALPLPPIELATVLFALMHDPDAEVKDTSRASLENLPPNVMDVVARGRDVHPAVSLAPRARESRRRGSAAKHSRSTPQPTTPPSHSWPPCPSSASSTSSRTTRSGCCAAPEIVEALGSNPLAGRSVIDRILTFLGIGRRSDAEAPRRLVGGQRIPGRGRVAGGARRGSRQLRAAALRERTAKNSVRERPDEQPLRHDPVR